MAQTANVPVRMAAAVGLLTRNVRIIGGHIVVPDLQVSSADKYHSGPTEVADDEACCLPVALRSLTCLRRRAG